MTEFIYAIRDGDGFWFHEIRAGEAMFITEQAAAKRYDNAAAALDERDVLANLLQDEALTVRQIAPVGNVVVSRGELGDEHRINWNSGEQP
jgi:hypothetical protein